jgi:glycine oxidase
VKSADAVIIGAGVIGLSLACELRRRGASVIVLERHQPGREASWAAGGMIAFCEAGQHPGFRSLARTSAEMYPQFVHRLQDESGVNVDFRQQGKIQFLEEEDEAPLEDATLLDEKELHRREPEIEFLGRAVFLPEPTIDPRALLDALIRSALHLGVEIDSGAEVSGLEIDGSRVSGAITTKSRYAGRQIVICAGAWSSALFDVKIRPIKGQMLAVIPQAPLLQHVVQGNGVYVIPRGDGRLIIGSTLEDVGFDKRVDPDAIQQMLQAAAMLVPNIGQARIHESWAGLRPCSVDKLPVLGATGIGGVFVATGHYRDGIMLAPITAEVIAQMMQGEVPSLDISEFSLRRFAGQ